MRNTLNRKEREDDQGSYSRYVKSSIGVLSCSINDVILRAGWPRIINQIPQSFVECM